MRVKVDRSGFNRLRKKIEAVSKPQSVSFKELFPDDFMCKNTEFVTIQEMVDASGFPLETPGEFKAIPEAEWNQFIVAHTNFKSWEEMKQTAAANHIRKQLGL